MNHLINSSVALLLAASPLSAAIIVIGDGGGPAGGDITSTNLQDFSTGGDSGAGITFGFSSSANAGYASGSGNYWNNTEYDFNPNATTTATWTFGGLTVGSQWEVLTTWVPQANRTAAAPYTIQGGGIIPVNQQSAPAGGGSFTDSGGTAMTFSVLGNATADSSGNLVVTLGGSPGGYVIVDAVGIRQIPEPSAALLGGLGVLALLRRRR